MRLKAIAVERAPNIATLIQTICHAVGIPRAASTAPRNANGSANSVCSILIISSVVRILWVTVGIKLKTQNSKLSFALPSCGPSNAGAQTDRESESKDGRPAFLWSEADDRSRDSRRRSERPRV